MKMIYYSKGAIWPDVC